MKITICGDFVPIARGIGAVKDRTALGADVLKVLKGSDYSIVNLEAPVAIPNERRIIKNGPHLSTSSETIKYLKECGVNTVTLANNHFYDYGQSGVQHTLDACKTNDVMYVGGGLTAEELSRILYYEKDGVKVAILNYCENEFSIQDEEGSNPINPIKVFYDISKAKGNGSDHIVIITHGGHEGYNLPSPRMKQLYRYFVDLGANVIINHHQHCFSGYEEYNGGMIFYGLGNFFFDDFRAGRNRSDIWNYGYMVAIELNKHTFNYKLFPYCQCKEKASTSLITGDSSFFKQLELLNRVIANDMELKNSFDKWCSQQKNVMITWFTPYSNKLLMALCRRGLLPKFMPQIKRIQILNTIRCESHRDIAINILK